MMPTPNVHLESQRDVYADLAEPLQRTEVPLFYVTDRAPERDEAGNLYYGSGRSASLAFGTAVVDLENKGQTTIASDRKPWSVPIYANLNAAHECSKGPQQSKTGPTSSSRAENDGR